MNVSNVDALIAMFAAVIVVLALVGLAAVRWGDQWNAWLREKERALEARRRA